MAVTLTEPAVAEGTVHVSFPILKWEQDEDGDLVVKGVATDGTLDSDEQVVSPEWSAKALDAWISTGGNVRMSHDPRRPVGKGLQVEVNKDGSGKHWVTSVIVDRDAQKLIKKGVLTAYSVGIARPVIKHDPTGKARGGIIVGGELCELSVVDRPSNKNSYLEIAKAAADGTCEFTGKVFGADAAGDDFVSVDLPPGASISISPKDFAKLHTFKRELVTKTAGAVVEADAEKRDVSTAERRSLASEGNALPDGSYPIESTGDLDNAAHLARTGHGDVAAARRLIARRAEELGVANPLDESDSAKKSATAETAEPVAEKAETGLVVTDALALAVGEKFGLTPRQVKEMDADALKALLAAHDLPAAEKAADAPAEQQEATPDVTKDPKPKPVKKAKKPKKMPPWLKDGDGDSKSSDDDAGKAAEPEACKHVWQIADPEIGSVECSKCHTPPSVAAGVTAAPMDPAPVKELLESDGPVSTKGATPASASGAVGESMKPVPAHREPDGAPMEAFEATASMSDGDDEKPTRIEAATGMKAATTGNDLAPDPEVAALLRFKATGTDEDLGRLHDLTCPAYHPEQVAKYHPYADLATLIDAGAWMRKALTAAAGPLEAAREMQETWQAANLLKAADPADLNQWRLELHKAFRDANPGPGSYPTPGCVSPQPYNRPVLTDGRAANGVDYDGPNSSPQVATSAPNAQNFDRPPLGAGHQSPSPSHMKASFEYPSEQGRPTQLNYAAMQKEQARQALVRMHHHLSRQFPEACPITLDTTPPQQENHPVPTPAGIGKAADPAPAPAAEAPEAAFKATPEDGDLFIDADVYKGMKKRMKKLGKKVIAGKITRDQALSELGRRFTQKGTEEPQEAVEKAASGIANRDQALKALGLDPALPVTISQGVQYQGEPGMNPEVIKAAVADATSELKDLLVKQQETFTTKLAEQQRVIDAIADQPDPGTASFAGLGIQPTVQKSRRPAGVTDVAESAARAQDMIRRNLQHQYQTHSDPYVREAASNALASLGVGMEAPPMT